ncbi:MAG: rhamnulokinase [Brevinema sp.]
MHYFISIDLGASSGRVILYKVDIHEQILEERILHRFQHDMCHDGSYLYWDMDSIKQEIIIGLRFAAEYNVESIGIDSWGVDIVLTDKDGKYLIPAVAYRDHRTDGTIDQFILETGLTHQEIYQKTGIQFLQFNTLYQLYSIKKTNPEILKQTKQIRMISDEINYFLTGCSRIEYTNASTTQMLNIHTRTWDKDLCQAVGISPEQFSPFIYPGECLGSILPEIVIRTGLSPDVRVVAVASHDTASAVASISSDGGAYLSSGTWSLIGIERHTPVINDFTLMESISHEAGINNTYRILKNIMGMWLISEIQKDSQDKRSFLEILQKSQEEIQAQRFIDPNHRMFLNPQSMIKAIDNYLSQTGQKPLSNINQYYAVIFQNLALSYAYYLDLLLTIQPISYLHIIGGGSQNDLINQLTANYSGKTILAGPSEASSLGNVLAQMLYLFPDIKHAREFLASCLQYKYYHSIHDPNTLQEYINFIKKI